MPKKKIAYYTEEQFKEIAGIKTRQHLQQLCKGYNKTRKGEKIFFPPKLTEGKDFIETNKIFFPSALNKIGVKKENG